MSPQRGKESFKKEIEMDLKRWLGLISAKEWRGQLQKAWAGLVNRSTWLDSEALAHWRTARNEGRVGANCRMPLKVGRGAGY